MNPIKPGALGLGPWHLGTSIAIEIDVARHSALRAAVEGIIDLLAFEDRYAMVIDNLMDLERHLFNWSLIDMLRPMEGFAELFAHKRDANRHLGNLLSACRQYIDQTHHHLKQHFAKTPVTSQAALSEQYDLHLSFRVMEALRNYVQHEDLGVHSVSVGGSWLESSGNKARRYVVSIGLDLDHLAKATKFKAATLAELKALTKAPDLKQMIREYISALAVAHSKMRKALDLQVKEWIATIVEAFSDVQEAYPNEKLHWLAVFEQHENGTRTKLLDVGREPGERLTSLQRTNQTTLNLGPAYASTEAVQSV
ncbi:MAG: hypothetical protein WDM79_15305 [Terricaulis sp.]